MIGPTIPMMGVDSRGPILKSIVKHHSDRPHHSFTTTVHDHESTSPPLIFPTTTFVTRIPNPQPPSVHDLPNN